MRFRRFPVVVVLTTFFLAVIVVGWLLFQSDSPPTADEESIAEIVFKDAIEQSADCAGLFLSLDGRGDPSDAFMERFAGYGQRVQKGSYSGIYQIWGYIVSTKPEEGRCKLLLRFAPDSPISDGEALVYLGMYTPQGFQSSYSYHLARRGDEWMITDVKLVFIV